LVHLAFTAVGVIIISWFFNKLERRVSAQLAAEMPPDDESEAVPTSKQA
jgi:hypothetical protein